MHYISLVQSKMTHSSDKVTDNSNGEDPSEERCEVRGLWEYLQGISRADTMTRNGSSVQPHMQG